MKKVLILFALLAGFVSTTDAQKRYAAAGDIGKDSVNLPLRGTYRWYTNADNKLRVIDGFGNKVDALTLIGAIGNGVVTGITQQQASLLYKAIGYVPSWAEITGKPSLFSGAYLDLTGRPTLGTAAALNIAASGNASTGEVVKGNDTRLTDPRPPSGPAGGFLSGSFPNPGVNATVLRSMFSAGGNLTYDAANGVFGYTAPTLGTAAALNAPASGNAATTEVVKGNDTRLTDARTPTSHTHTAAQTIDLASVVRGFFSATGTGASYNSATGQFTFSAGTSGVTSYTGLTDRPTLGTASPLNVAASGNAASGEVVKGSDTRLTDGRPPTGTAGGALAGTYPNPTLAGITTAGTVGGGGQVVESITRNAAGQVTGVTTVAAGSGGGTGVTFSEQSYSTGTALTVSSSTSTVSVVYINPAATVAALTLTLPATPVDKQVVEISFGGTLTSGTVVTAMTVAPNSGQSLRQPETLTSIDAGETLRYRYRQSTTTWYAN